MTDGTHRSMKSRPWRGVCLGRESPVSFSSSVARGFVFFSRPPRKKINKKPTKKLSSPLAPPVRHTNGNLHIALGDRRSERITARSTLGCATRRHPRLGLAVRCGDLALSPKNMPFCTFFTYVQPKHPNGAISVNIEGFRPCLSKSSYGAPRWALVVRLMQMGRHLNRPINRHFMQPCLFGHFGHFWLL